jgi:hypothetical protein
VLQLGRIALHVSKGRARPFHFFPPETRERTVWIWQECVKKRLTVAKNVGLVRLINKEKLKVTYAKVL